MYMCNNFLDNYKRGSSPVAKDYLIFINMNTQGKWKCLFCTIEEKSNQMYIIMQEL